MLKRRYATLKKYLQATGESQADLAGRIGVTPAAMSLYVRGKRIPQPAIALRIHKVCGVPLEALLSPEQAA